MGPNQMFLQASKLSSPEFIALHQFYLSMTMNFQDLTIEDRLKRASNELLKLVQSGHPGSSDKTYDVLKSALTTKILNNKDTLNLPIVSLMAPALSFLSPGTGMQMLPTNIFPIQQIPIQ